MKKYIFLVITALAFVFNGCKKTETGPEPVTIVPEISIQNISYPTFDKSTWNHVVGGNLVIEYALKDASDAVTSRIKDSVNINNVSTYKKVLTKGKYDISVAAGNAIAVADTFLRFNGALKAYVVESKQAASLTVTTNDGLITIGKSFIKDKTTPTFKADGDSKEYKLGLSNGFYYLYIKNGVKGNISFVASATGQSVSKSLSIAALKQYNMEVVAGKGALQIVFAPFTYNQVAVGSTTLATLFLNADVFANTTTYFVATDENGTIINEYKYVSGQTNVKLAALQPYEKDRFNLYVITIPNETNITPDINCYMQIKKGTTYTSPASVSYNPKPSTIKPHFKNISTFEQLFASTDWGGFSVNSPANVNQFTGFNYTAGSKLWVQLFKNNQYTYNMFTIPNGTTDFDVDINSLNKTPQQQLITSPGTNLQVEVVARNTENGQENGYNLGTYRSATNKLTYYYPTESFSKYSTRVMYTDGNGLNNTIIKYGPTIVPADQDYYFGATFKGYAIANAMPDFKPLSSGTFDYYFANFISSGYQFNVFSPAAANVNSLKFPDFSKYFNKTINLSQQLIKSFGLYQYDGFQEGSIPYKTYNSNRFMNSKAVEYQWNN